jgi:DNA-3-methyladenine glycosylase
MTASLPSDNLDLPALGKPLKRSFFGRSVHDVAPDLIGTTLLVDGIGGIIVEVEAYHHTDPAAHSYIGETERNGVMFGPPGRCGDRPRPRRCGRPCH